MTVFSRDSLPLQNFDRYHKRETTRAVQMEDAFECVTINGDTVHGESGDYLCLDFQGHPYPCARSVFEGTMELVEPW